MEIFYDVDTQKDFMNKDGALYVPDAELIKPNLRKLTDFARENFIPGIGSVDRHFGTPEYKHREGELQRNGGAFPDHCMDETKGQQKIYETNITFRDAWPVNIVNLLDKKLDETSISRAITYLKNIQDRSMKQGENILIEKQSYDVFTNLAFPAFLNMADIKQAVVYGVATDYCVKAAVLGMQKKGIQCYVVEDAIKGIEEATTKAALEEMAKAGAKLITTKDVLEGKVK